MDKKLTLPTDALDDSRCSLCNNFLSVPPILFLSDGKENKCGRCHLVETKAGIRNETLESILRHLYFPCTYGCQHVMPWEEVKNHENECQERTLQCPLYYQNCDTIITISKLEDHFNEKHLNNIMYGNVLTYDLENHHIVAHLALAGKELFFIYLFLGRDFNSFDIFSLQPSQKYTKYDITITDDNTTCITYKNRKIRQFDERLHCYKCMQNKCHLDYHPYAKKYNKPNTNRTHIEQINGKAIRELLKSPTSLKFTIQLLAEDDIKKAEQQNILHKCFECSNCCGLMMKPIYLCRSGHSICDVCKLSLDKCPNNCESEIDVRNFALEEMTENVELPCRYEGQGCAYAGYVESLYKHEKSCAYKSEA